MSQSSIETKNGFRDFRKPFLTNKSTTMNSDKKAKMNTRLQNDLINIT